MTPDDVLLDLLDQPLDAESGAFPLRDAAPADIRTAIDQCTREFSAAVGQLGRVALSAEMLDELGDRTCALLARIEELRIALAWVSAPEAAGEALRAGSRTPATHVA